MSPAEPTIRVLLTEDVLSDAELEVRELKRAGLRLTHRVVTSEESFTQALRDFAPDVILSDFSMPGFDGMAALRIAREMAPDTPFVFVSGTIGEEYAIRAMKNGATDYVLKSNLVRLPATVERAIGEARDRREKRRTEAELEIARERLTSIFTALPDMLWSVDAQTDQIVYASPASKEIFGHAPEAFLHDPDLWLEVVHADDRPRVRAAWERVRAGEAYEIEYRAMRPDGTVCWVNDRGRQIRDARGAVERIDGITRDVTQRVEQRNRIERLSRIRELLGALNASIVRVRERDLLLDEFCRIAVSRGGFTLARIITLDAAGTASIAATTEADPVRFQKMVDAYNRQPAAADSLLARALRSGQPVISNDLAADERIPAAVRADLTRDGNYALALLPTVVEGRIAGLVALRAREAGFFDQEELRLLSEMSANMSFALELIAKQDRISYLALYDTLTGLPNRTLFHERLTQAIDGARRAGAPLALALLDLERFKAINDTLGQGVGDRVLQQVAQRLRESAGDIQRLARLGNDVFALMFQDIASVEDVARRLEASAAKFFGVPFQVDGREVRLAGKAGIAVYPDDGADADALFRNAEASLKRAKETGERYLFYAPHINARVSEQVELEHRLRRAVDNGELFLHYQPKVDMASRAVVGVEALLRWQQPGEAGLVSPARFVPVLEQTGLIFEAGRQAVAAASATFRRWQVAGLTAPRIAVNVSALQLRRKSFVEDITSALRDMGADGGGIDLEITESLLMSDVDESIRKLRALRETGMHIALDDFGTGYSSLAYLSKLPVDTLKIDRGFVRGMTEKSEDTSIISIIISLAQALRLKTVAEGVESEQQAQLLRLLRCDQAQGYLFSPPVAAERIEAQLKAV
jgi:diguanylate cyclase (GGDEF)-like protein/PAS domain S-box-containing protein